MPLTYDRRIRAGLEKALTPGGAAQSLAVRHVEDPGRVDLQLRGYPGQARNWVTLYCGLTKPLDLTETNGRYRLGAHATWRHYGPNLPWNTPLDEGQLREIWPLVDTYLDEVLPVIKGSRWSLKEGDVQTAVSRLRHAGMVVFDREACPSFADTAEKLQVMAEERDRLTAGLTGSEPWWSIPQLGEECDALAIDANGRLLAIEVKPASAAARSITFAPLQAAYYARLFQRWAAGADDPAASLDEVISQCARLGLAPAGGRGRTSLDRRAGRDHRRRVAQYGGAAPLPRGPRPFARCRDGPGAARLDARRGGRRDRSK